ncbi:hypothetical protein JCM11641_006080 [Rhodosporidiobolus odoratus]
MTADPSLQLLLSLLALPPSSLPASLTNHHVHSTLCYLLQSASETSASSTQLRTLLHALVARIAALPKSPLDLRLLTLYLAAFLPRNAKLAQTVVEDALASNVRLAGEVRTTGIGALKQALEANEAGSGAAKTLLAMVRGTVSVLVPPSGGTQGGEAAKNLVAALVEGYDRLSAQPQPTREQDQDQLRLAILETSASLLTTLSASLRSASASAAAIDLLRALLTLLLPSPTKPSSLARDLQTHYTFASSLSEAVQGSVGPTARAVKDQLGALRRAGENDGIASKAEWLERLRRAEKVGGVAVTGLGADKGEKTTVAGGKGKAREGAADAEREAQLASAIAQLLDLFPHLTPKFLRSCLIHPSLAAASTSQAVERVTEALLEGALPPDLQSQQDQAEEAAPAPAPPAPSPPSPPRTVTVDPASHRRNVYDDDALFSRGTLLVGGKDRKLRDAPVRPADARQVQLDEQLKASIIALAERPSSDEEDEDEDGEGEAFLEDDPTVAERALKVGDGEPRDGEETEEEEEEEQHQQQQQGDGPQGGSTASTSTVPPPRPMGAYDPAVVLTLESAYLRSPNLFNRDSATRRGKERKLLREKTRLGDEQIEGWKVMLERDPKKLQKLQDKHQDLAATANHPARATPTPSASASASQRPSQAPSQSSSRPPSRQQQQKQQQQQQQSQQQQPSHRGGRGGGQQGGRGGRGTGVGSSGGGRGGKGDGGRKESDRAVRGRDKKMQKMGAGL